jgi:glycolate oxidase FAD binding subunit
LTELASRPALGLHTARLTGPPDAVAKTFDAWRSQLLDLGASVLLHERPAEVDALLDALGPAPSSAGLVRALQHRLDPGGRCGAGRLGSWLTHIGTRED